MSVSEGPSVMDQRERVLNINIGILGHVDSGKTSLVKALSTSLSTAALDKHPQSQQRGITLDLGFSAFTLPLPPHIAAATKNEVTGLPEYDLVQFTLVDCPGHASLIRTIIGGAQIIDMIILVVDANKGIQTQTAECIVIGEITTDILIVALNKIDMLPEEEREERVSKMTKKIHKVLQNSKFANCMIIPISAAVGGEKVAAIVNSTSLSSNNHEVVPKVATEGVEQLIHGIESIMPIPIRNISAPFYFAIDHCFPIRGHGSVITGTVLSGSVATNQVIEIPQLQLQRKVKSMQMFHKPVKFAKQGDRVGICLTNLDPKTIERSVAAAPNTVPLISNAVCLLKKIRFFKFPCKSGSKFHITVGHSTIIATVTFFGSAEINSEIKEASQQDNHNSLMLSTSYQREFPNIQFNRNSNYLLQDDMLENSTTLAVDSEPIQWALLQFQQPVFAPKGSLVIGSRLDVDSKDSSSTQHCRLSFYGPIKDILDDEADIKALGVFIWKNKECEVFKVTDFRDGLVYEIIGWKLITQGNSIHPFIGFRLITQSGVVGSIVNTFGADGMFKVKFEYGARVKVGDKLQFKYKKYVFDKTRRFEQPEFEDKCRDEPFTNVHEAGLKETLQTQDAKRNNKNKKKHKDVTESIMPEEVGSLLPTEEQNSGLPMKNDVIESSIEESQVDVLSRRYGKVESIKASEDGDSIAIVSGLFKMEENIKLFVGKKIYKDTDIIGEIIGPFGKLGKCKIKIVPNYSIEKECEVYFMLEH